MQTELQLYYKDVSKRLLCKRKVKRRFLQDFKNGVREFIENHPDATPQEVRAHFGTPEEIAGEFLASLQSNEVKRALDWKRVLLIGLGIALLLLALYIAISLIDGHLAATGYHGGGLTDLGNTKLN